MKYNKYIFKGFIIMGTLACIVNINSMVFATSINDVPKAQKNISKKCHIEICITDNTAGEFKDEIQVTLLNADASNAYDYIVTPENYRSNIRINGDIEQDSYSIAISYPHKDSYIIRDQSGNEISQFIADTDKQSLNWVIESKEMVVGKNNSNPEDIWNKFLNRALEIETNPEYKGILKYYSDLEKLLTQQYIKVYKDATVDDYLKLSITERFLYHTTYILPVEATTYGQYNLYLESWDKFNNYVIGGTNSVIKRYGGQEFLDEYQEVMKWQYDYFIENSAFYNFITGEDSLGRKIEGIQLEENNKLIKEKTNSVLSENNIVNNKDDNSNKEDSVNDDEQSNNGIWSEFFKRCKSNILSIMILVILIIVVVGVGAYKRYKAIQDEE